MNTLARLRAAWEQISFTFNNPNERPTNSMGSSTPFDNAHLRQALSNGVEEPIEFVGRSLGLLKVKEICSQAARSRASVFIEGESGTGKGLVAEFIHRLSQSTGPLVKINCTAIPENLLEAELFGYEAGAFTGASKRKRGRVELAFNGTLFLDEIGIAPITLQ